MTEPKSRNIFLLRSEASIVLTDLSPLSGLPKNGKKIRLWEKNIFLCNRKIPNLVENCHSWRADHAGLELMVVVVGVQPNPSLQYKAWHQVIIDTDYFGRFDLISTVLVWLQLGAIGVGQNGSCKKWTRSLSTGLWLLIPWVELILVYRDSQFEHIDVQSWVIKILMKREVSWGECV